MASALYSPYQYQPFQLYQPASQFPYGARYSPYGHQHAYGRDINVYLVYNLQYPEGAGVGAIDDPYYYSRRRVLGRDGFRPHFIRRGGYGW